MKKEFSTKWVGSKQPRKQRKYRHNAPLHVKHKFLSAHLSKSLKEKYGKRSLPLKKGDEVLVMRGSFRKKKAKVDSINVKTSKVVLENITRTKKDGTKVPVVFAPSSLMIETLNLEDNKRISALERNPKKASSEKAEKTENKTTSKTSNKEK